MTPPADSPLRRGGPECPECGNHWRKTGGFIEGRRKRRPGIILLGAIVATLGITADRSRPLPRRILTA